MQPITIGHTKGPDAAGLRPHLILHSPWCRFPERAIPDLVLHSPEDQPWVRPCPCCPKCSPKGHDHTFYIAPIAIKVTSVRYERLPPLTVRSRQEETVHHGQSGEQQKIPAQPHQVTSKSPACSRGRYRMQGRPGSKTLLNRLTCWCALTLPMAGIECSFLRPGKLQF